MPVSDVFVSQARSALVSAESAALPAGQLPEVVDLGHATDAHPPEGLAQEARSDQRGEDHAGLAQRRDVRHRPLRQRPEHPGDADDPASNPPSRGTSIPVM